MSAFTPATVAVIRERDQDRCALCGKHIRGERGMGWSVHHREPRGAGGTKATHVNKPSNGVLLCGSGTTHCHGYIEQHRDRGTQLGFLVSRLGVDRPFQVLIDHAVHGSCWLSDDGTVLTQDDAMKGIEI